MSKETSDSAWDAKALGGSWKRKIVNPDLLEERAKCTFDQTELNRLFFDHADYIQQMNELVKEHPELIEGNGAGIVAAQDPEVLASSLIRLLKDPELRDGFADQGRALVGKKYSVDAVTTELLSLYAGLVDGPAAEGKLR